MATKSKTSKKFSLVISRVIKAPCPMVYSAWTEPKQMAQWWSPIDIECMSVKAEVKVGGKFRIQMLSKDGKHVAYGIYKKLTRNKRLQFTWGWEKNEMPETIVDVEFKDQGKTTKVTLTHKGFIETQERDEHRSGWTTAIEKFAGLIEQGKIKA